MRRQPEASDAQYNGTAEETVMTSLENLPVFWARRPTPAMLVKADAPYAQGT
jgi:hypothetical protein